MGAPGGRRTIEIRDFKGLYPPRAPRTGRVPAAADRMINWNLDEGALRFGDQNPNARLQVQTFCETAALGTYNVGDIERFYADINGQTQPVMLVTAQNRNIGFQIPAQASSAGQLLKDNGNAFASIYNGTAGYGEPYQVISINGNTYVICTSGAGDNNNPPALGHMMVFRWNQGTLTGYLDWAGMLPVTIGSLIQSINPSAGAGLTPGVRYNYKFVLVTSGRNVRGRCDSFFQAGVTTGANARNTLTFKTTHPAPLGGSNFYTQATGIEVYRQFPGVGNPYWYHSTLGLTVSGGLINTVNGGTTWVDSKDDQTLIADALARTLGPAIYEDDHEPPPLGIVSLGVHEGRLVAITRDGKRMYFSRLGKMGDPENWASNDYEPGNLPETEAGYLNMVYDRLPTVEKILRHQGQTFFGGRNGIFRLTGDNALNFNLALGDNRSVKIPCLWQSCKNSMVWVSEDDVYMGSDYGSDSQRIDRGYWFSNYFAGKTVVDFSRNNMAAAYCAGSYYLLAPFSTADYPGTGQIKRYEFATGQWTEINPSSPIKANTLCVDETDGGLFYVSGSVHTPNPPSLTFILRNLHRRSHSPQLALVSTGSAFRGAFYPLLDKISYWGQSDPISSATYRVVQTSTTQFQYQLSRDGGATYGALSSLQSVGAGGAMYLNADPNNPSIGGQIGFIFYNPTATSGAIWIFTVEPNGATAIPWARWASDSLIHDILYRRVKCYGLTVLWRPSNGTFRSASSKGLRLQLYGKRPFSPTPYAFPPLMLDAHDIDNNNLTDASWHNYQIIKSQVKFESPDNAAEFDDLFCEMLVDNVNIGQDYEASIDAILVDVEAEPEIDIPLNFDTPPLRVA